MVGVDQLAVFEEDLLEVFPGRSFEVGVAKQGGRVEHGHYPPVSPFEPRAADLGDPERGIEQTVEGSGTQKNDDPGIHKFDLLKEVRQTHCSFLGKRGAVVGGAAFHDVADENMFFPVEVACCQDLVKQLPRASNERTSGKVLVPSRSFSDQEYLCMGIAFAKHYFCTCSA